MKLITIRTDNLLSIQHDGWMRKKIADSGWRGLWNSFVIWTVGIRYPHQK